MIISKDCSIKNAVYEEEKKTWKKIGSVDLKTVAETGLKPGSATVGVKM